MQKRVEPLAELISNLVIPCDVTDDESIDYCDIRKRVGQMILVMQLLLDKELKGRYINTT